MVFVVFGCYGYVDWEGGVGDVIFGCDFEVGDVFVFGG